MTAGGSGGSEGPGLPNDGRFKQIVCSILLTITTLYCGAIQGWMSPMTTKLRAGDTPLGPLSKDDISNLATIPNYIGLFTGVALAVILNKLGRKCALLYMAVASTAGGLVLSFANSMILLCVGRAMAGIGSGAVTVSPMIVSESVHSSLRGTLMALCSFQINPGILFSYVFGKLLSYKWFNLVITAMPAMIIVLGIYLPETPHFLVSKNRTKDAMQSLVWWRGGNREVARLELETIEPPPEGKISFARALSTRQSKIAFLVTIGGYLFQTFSGIHVVINFSSLIFDDIGNGPLPPDDLSIIIAVLITLATFANSVLIDFAGRRPLLIYSSLGSAVSLGALTTYIIILKSGAEMGSLTWVPVACIGSFVVSYGLGVAVVPSVLMNELCPTESKPTLAACVGFSAFGAVTAVLQTFVFIEEHIGLYMCFLIPTVMNVLGMIFFYIVVPETKNKSLTQIANELNRVKDGEHKEGEE
ncbi:sugar transporter [Nesidiocoris tenuis]|uniref:Sugar transporter n=1 Tax=Nesidiocoris tenuis TaxID=355587 RepID=A0ABN7AEG9_9HEMI|nr:sugar transporter [Nesidiocoris tenuis]